MSALLRMLFIIKSSEEEEGECSLLKFEKSCLGGGGVGMREVLHSSHTSNSSGWFLLHFGQYIFQPIPRYGYTQMIAGFRVKEKSCSNGNFVKSREVYSSLIFSCHSLALPKISPSSIVVKVRLSTITLPLTRTVSMSEGLML